MARSKANRFDKLLYEQSLWSKAHGHPARIIIIEHLRDNGTTSYKDLCKHIPLARVTVSQHLATLRKLGFVTLHELYPNSYYTLNTNRCKDLCNKMKSLL